MKDMVIAMQEYTDIHSHILAGIDDGAGDLETSLEMLRIAEDNGITQIILTPHNKPERRNVSPESLAGMAEELQQKAFLAGIAVKLHIGTEIYYRSEVPELLGERRICKMADSSYVLVEFNPGEDFEYIRNGIYQLMAGGFWPILAHAERYRSVGANVECVEELIELGCYIQINAGSIMGDFGRHTKHFTRRLLKQRLVHFVATDAHDTGKRAPGLFKCAAYIKKKYGDDYAEQLLHSNPGKIIDGECI